MKLFPVAALILTGMLIASAEPLVAQQTEDNTQTIPAATPAAPQTTSSLPAKATAPAKDTVSATQASKASDTGAQSNKVLHVSKDYIKRLANIGYYPKNHKGQLVFCKKEVPLGTRFEREICMDGEQLAMILEKNEAQREALQHIPCVGGKSCGEH
jgi:hypothetical protein